MLCAVSAPYRTAFAHHDIGAQLWCRCRSKMMVARSAVFPRKIIGLALLRPQGAETLICRSARTCTCNCSSSACSSMAISGPAAVCAEAAADCTGASLQRSTPLARSWPPLTGASVRLPLRPKMRAALPRPPARRNSSIVNWLPLAWHAADRLANPHHRAPNARPGHRRPDCHASAAGRDCPTAPSVPAACL